jgi:DNA-binding GntR family transcriptional regulator
LFSDSLENDNSLRNKVYMTIKKRILNGEYPPEFSLIELKLSEEFGVSRTPVREALRQLELDGLVHLVPNKGVYVSEITSKDISDVYEMRMLIEGLGSKWAALNATEAELEKMKEILDLCEFYTMKGEYLKVLELDGKFHDIIFKASKSKPLNLILKQLHEYIQRARKASLSSPGRAEAAFQEHKAIYDAIKNRDGESAETLTREHILKAKESLLKTFNNK